MKYPRFFVTTLCWLTVGACDDERPGPGQPGETSSTSETESSSTSHSTDSESKSETGPYANCPENPRNECTVPGIANTPLFNAYMERTGCPPRICGTTNDCLPGETCVTPNANAGCIADYACEDAMNANGEIFCQCTADPDCNESYCDEV